ncbi:hypothetical protein [Tsukamurella spumae]|uniref:Uncharacterized protein n=1 Tax=Tsukamurella spumae TaxID=44753 RepID=A0A846X2J0_9ACTN|nr:hypothetical protein [Tsukamurella spumae]NKY19728.1 hypothetical protein [Tsukamurella spumae]
MSGVGELGRAWKSRGDQVTAIGHRTLALQIAGEGTFPTSLRKSLDALAQACTTQGAALSEAGKAAIKQGSHEETFQEQYKLATASLTKAVAAKQQALVIASMGGSPAYMASAQAAETNARAGRKLVLDNGVAGTQMNLDCLPGHARDATESVGKAQGQLTLQTGFEPTGNNVAPPTAPSAPAPRVNTGGNAKPSSNTPSKPTDTTPDAANKNSVDDKGQTPTGQQPPNQQAQQLPQQSPQQGQQGAPQAGGQAAPAGGAPAGGQGAKPSSAVPVPAVQPIRTDSGNKGGGVRPSTPPSSPQGNTPPVGKGGVIGSGSGGGSTASPAGGQQANKAGGGIGSGVGGGTTSGTNSTGARPMMGGMMGGAGAGHGAGGTARPKGEVKSTDPKMSAEDIAQQALGGIVRDDDDGKPVTPPPPGSNGKAPVPPPIPPKP